MATRRDLETVESRLTRTPIDLGQERSLNGALVVAMARAIDNDARCPSVEDLLACFSTLMESRARDPGLSVGPRYRWARSTPTRAQAGPVTADRVTLVRTHASPVRSRVPPSPLRRCPTVEDLDRDLGNPG